MLISGEAADETDDRGRPVLGDTMLLLFNGGFDDTTCALPHVAGDGQWRCVVDTASDQQGPVASSAMHVKGFSLMLLRYGAERRVDVGGAQRALEAGPPHAVARPRAVPNEPALSMAGATAMVDPTAGEPTAVDATAVDATAVDATAEASV
jgi:glycogen operon protein